MSEALRSSFEPRLFGAQGAPDRHRRQRLRRVVRDEAFSGLGLAPNGLVAAALRPLLRAPADRFAADLLAFDSAIERAGLGRAALSLLGSYSAGLRVSGADHVPRAGPLLVLANHPGLTDALAVLSALPRDDVVILARPHPMLDLLPGIQRHLLTVRHGLGDNLAALRRAVAHLRAGGCVLTFPAGRIEADPALEPEAARSDLGAWSDSCRLFARQVAALRVQPVLISGVLAQRAWCQPLLRLRRDTSARREAAAAWQVLCRLVSPTPVQTAFGPTLRADAGVAARVQAGQTARLRRLGSG